MSQIRSIINGKIVFIIIMLICILISNKSFARTKIEVGDVLWKMESIRSETMNDVNDYCAIYEEAILKRNNIHDVEELGFTIVNFLKTKNIKINTNYLTISLEKAKISKKK